MKITDMRIAKQNILFRYMGRHQKLAKGSKVWGNASHMALSLDDGWVVGYLALSANIATDKILKDISAFMLPRILLSLILCIFLCVHFVTSSQSQ